MGKEKESAKSTKEKAAAARAAQQAAERRRERTVRIVGAIGVVVVVALIIGLAVIVPRMSGDNSASNGLPGPDPNAAIPAGTLGADSPYAWGVPYGDAPDTAPVLEIWEDFQCPACASLEELNGLGIQGLALGGQAQLIWRPASFLDNNLGTEYSHRATAAWGCAIDAGKTAEYHDLIYANIPEPEGTGWPPEQLLAFGTEAGIEGEAFATFEQCLADGKYLPWAANNTQAFYDSEIPGTPTGVLNGQQLTGAQLADAAELERLVAEAAQAG